MSVGVPVGTRHCIKLLTEVSSYGENVIYNALGSVIKTGDATNLVAALFKVCGEMERCAREDYEHQQAEAIMEDERGN